MHEHKQVDSSSFAQSVFFFIRANDCMKVIDEEVREKTRYCCTVAATTVLVGGCLEAKNRNNHNEFFMLRCIFNEAALYEHTPNLLPNNPLKLSFNTAYTQRCALAQPGIMAI